MHPSLQTSQIATHPVNHKSIQSGIHLSTHSSIHWSVIHPAIHSFSQTVSQPDIQSFTQHAFIQPASCATTPEHSSCVVLRHAALVVLQDHNNVSYQQNPSLRHSSLTGGSLKTLEAQGSKLRSFDSLSTHAAQIIRYGRKIIACHNIMIVVLRLSYVIIIILIS